MPARINLLVALLKQGESKANALTESGHAALALWAVAADDARYGVVNATTLMLEKLVAREGEKMLKEEK